MDFKSWKADLESVLPHLRRVALGNAVIGIFAVSDRVALGLPGDRKLAREVIRLYRPMKWKARLLVILLEGMSRVGVLRFFGREGPLWESRRFPGCGVARISVFWGAIRGMAFVVFC